MSFTDKDIRVRYRTNENDFLRDFLIPVLKETKVYKRSVGFFSTSALVDLSAGLFAMAEQGGKVELICSPKLSAEDIESINLGYRTREEVIVGALEVSMTSPLSIYEEERLNLVATMIASGMMDLKLAFMETDSGFNLYHEKLAICIDQDGNKIAFTGSMNESNNAFDGNFESIWTFCSWRDGARQVAIAEQDFDRMWKDQTEKLKVIPFPNIIIDKLMAYKRDKVDYETDAKEFNYKDLLKRKSDYFQVPENVTLREYQRKAIDAWFSQDCKGIFSMCTGAGKTYTALAAMVELAEKLNDNLATVIVCPYIHLVSQWEEDVVKWGLTPIIAHSKSPTPNWKDRMKRACKRYQKDHIPFICITTNDTFSDTLQPFVEGFTENDNLLFIVDEAHNFGAQALSGTMPPQARYRIALSATIRRHMDKVGTSRLFNYFGNECIVYGLEEAIRDGALVPYEYHPIPVYLDEGELAEYKKLSKDLKKHIIQKKGKIKIAESGKHIIYARTRLLAGAHAKIALLEEMMAPYAKRKDKNILVYCGATMFEDYDSGVEERQIDYITSMLRTELKMSAQRFTSEENLQERQNIKEYFADGLIQVVTAIKCLDEGVNIPGIETAFILSSSRNPKEFIQRRGRLLRRSEGKTKAVIYDFVTLPRDLGDASVSDYEADRTILLGEMARIQEFGKLSLNPQDASALLYDIMFAYDTFLDIEEELQKQEEYYCDE